jgi:hypothetical protein
MKIVKNSKQKTIKKSKSILFTIFSAFFSTRAYSYLPENLKVHNLSDLGRVKPEAKFIP